MVGVSLFPRNSAKFAVESFGNMGYVPGFGQMGALDRGHCLRRVHDTRLHWTEQERRMFQARPGESIRDFHNVFIRHFLFDGHHASPTYQIGDDDCSVFGSAHHAGANFVFGLLDQRHGAHVQNGFGDVNYVGYLSRLGIMNRRKIDINRLHLFY